MTYILEDPLFREITSSFRESKTWTSESVKRHKALVRGSKGLINSVFRRFVDEDSRVLEVGSGDGYLQRVLEGNHRLQQSDKSKEMIGANRELNPSSNIVYVDILEKLPKGEYDVVCGINVLDTLSEENLGKAVDNIGEALRGKGKIVHLMDLPPYLDTFSERVPLGEKSLHFNRGLKKELECRNYSVLSETSLLEGIPILFESYFHAIVAEKN